MAVYVELVSAPRGGWLWHIIVVHWIKAFKAINQSAYLPNPDPQPINIYQYLIPSENSLSFFPFAVIPAAHSCFSRKSPQATVYQMTILQGRSEGMRHVCTLRWPGGLVAINLLSGKTEAWKKRVQRKIKKDFRDQISPGPNFSRRVCLFYLSAKFLWCSAQTLLNLSSKLWTLLIPRLESILKLQICLKIFVIRSTCIFSSIRLFLWFCQMLAGLCFRLFLTDMNPYFLIMIIYF